MQHVHTPTDHRPRPAAPYRSTAQVPPNESQLSKDFKQKQAEWAAMQQLSGKPVTMLQLKPPKPQPKRQQPTPSHKITSFFLPR